MQKIKYMKLLKNICWLLSFFVILSCYNNRNYSTYKKEEVHIKNYLITLNSKNNTVISFKDAYVVSILNVKDKKKVLLLKSDSLYLQYYVDTMFVEKNTWVRKGDSLGSVHQNQFLFAGFNLDGTPIYDSIKLIRLSEALSN